MLVFHILTSLVILATTAWLWHYHRERFLFIDALLGLFLFEWLQAGLVYGGALEQEWLLLGLRLLAWAVLLKAAIPGWRIPGVGVGILLLIAVIPAVPGADFLMWGFLTAVPLLALLTISQQQPYLPIIAPIAPAPTLRPVSVVGSVTAEMLTSQQPILECMLEGIIFSGNSGLIEYANQAAAMMLGLVQAEMLGHPVTDILAHVPMLGSTTNLNHFEMNGRILEGQMSIVYNQGGSTQGIVAILRDITARHHAETSRDDFLTTVSHELRTPLTAIKGYVELLASGAGGTISVSQKNFLTTIQRNVNHMVQLINSLIFATTIRSGRLEYSTGPTDLAQLIDQLVRELLPKAAQSGQKITHDLANNLMPIQADPMHMETVIGELLQNAIKYNRQGGKIHITARRQGNEQSAPGFVVISVQDEGIGIAEKDRSHIFDEFYRPDKSTAQVRAGGMGMGLSIVKALVEAYNGRIWFDGTPEQGSTFTFIIPTQQPKELPSI